MKTKVNFKELTDKINNSGWDAEYCHPDKWSSTDMDNCLNAIASWFFTEDEIEAAYRKWEDEFEADETINVVQWISHDLAIYALEQIVLNEFYYPGSATFNCIID